MEQIISLRKFDESDWDAYAGCESDSPMISDISLRIDDDAVGPLDEKFDGCLILDGGTILVDVLNDNKAPGENSHYYWKTFSSEHYALTWLKRLDKRFDLSADLCLLHSWLVDYHGFTMDN